MHQARSENNAHPVMCPCCNAVSEDNDYSVSDGDSHSSPFQDIKNRVLKDIFENMKVGHRCHKGTK